MLRLPSFAELRDLFLPSRSVVSAVAALSRAHDRLEDVRRLMVERIQRDMATHQDHLREVDYLNTKIEEHRAEQDRATRVSKRFAELLQ